jgi:hypothetical protein
MRAACLVFTFLLAGAGVAAAQVNSETAPGSSVVMLQTTTRFTAMAAANAWISDGSKHGPIAVHKLTINPGPNGKYVVRIEYTNTN